MSAHPITAKEPALSPPHEAHAASSIPASDLGLSEVVEQGPGSDESTYCVSCGSESSTLAARPHDFISGEHFELVRCDDCTLVYLNSQPDSPDLPHYYPVEHQTAEPAAYERMDAKPRIKLVESLRQGEPGSILDLGCGKGLLLAGLHEKGWDVAGTELSEPAARVAKKLGVPVRTVPVEQCGFRPGSFDVVTMYHSLEHMTAPPDTLSHLRTLVREDGHLVIEVPNYGSWYAKLFGTHWFHLDVPRHLYHFTPYTLAQMLSGAGFVVERMETRHPIYDAFGAYQSALNSLLPTKNLLNSLNTRQVTYKQLLRGSRPFWDILSAGISQLFFPIAFLVLLTISQSIDRLIGGGTLRIVARPI